MKPCVSSKKERFCIPEFPDDVSRWVILAYIILGTLGQILVTRALGDLVTYSKIGENVRAKYMGATKLGSAFPNHLGEMGWLWVVGIVLSYQVNFQVQKHHKCK